MKNPWIVLVLLLSTFPLANSLLAQGATQAVRNAAEGIQQTVEQSQMEVTAGPVDEQEKLAPGKIDKDPPREFTTTASGLKYRILRKSDGKKPKATDSVEVHYKGWLDDKTIFDSSYRTGKPASFPLSRVIPGWTEGLQLIGQGGMIELLVPARLGYGDRGIPGRIPPRSQLHFVVELLSIK